MNKGLFMLDLMEIERELGHFLEQQEYGLVDLQVASTGRGRTFRVFVERAEGTPADLADCTHLSPMVSLFLQSLGVFTNECALEVSSPGADRVLRKPEDFARFKGSRVQLSLRLEGRQFTVRGHLQGMEDDRVMLRSTELPRAIEGTRGIARDGESLLVPRDLISTVRLVPDV